MEMTKMALLVALTIGVFAAAGLAATEKFTPKQTLRWEYLSLPVEATGGYLDSADTDIEPSKPQLDALGKQGWELVGVITELQTTHPNFGSSQYVTGLQPNVRADRATLMFKRPWSARSSEMAATTASPVASEPQTGHD